MKLKLVILFILSLSSIVNAGLFDKDVTFESNKKELERKYPTNQEVILSYNNVLEDLRTSVVNISTKKRIKTGSYASPFFGDPFFDYFFRDFGNGGFGLPQDRVQSALGSGVIVTKDGYIITNHHVIEGADEVTVTIQGDKKEYDAKIIGSDSKSDLAVIKIKGDDFNAIKFYDSDKVKIGDIVFALGNPFGVGQTITQGMVSATGRSSVGIVEYEDFIQTDAPINPGNSGGALVNSAGYLIGINSAIISKGGGNVGIGFAIPVNMVKNIAKALIDDGEFTRAYLGVGISDISDDLTSFYGKKFGTLVTSVEEGTPAEKLGLKRGDLIIAVNEKEIESSSALRNMIGTLSPNTKVTITYLRDKKIYKGEVKLASSKGEKSSNGYGYEYEGMHIEPLTSQLRKQLGISSNITGVYVNGVDEESNASKAGIIQGDIIIQIENEEIKDIESFKSAISGFVKKRVYIYRRGAIIVTAL